MRNWFSEVPQVLRGPRFESRRIFHQGRIQEVTLEGEKIRLSTGHLVGEKEVAHLAPCEPSKIIAMHLNFDGRRIENRDAQPLESPSYFLKPPTTLSGHRGVVSRPESHKYLNYEGELALIVGAPLYDVLPEQAWGAIAGFTVANDFGLHDYRDADMGSMLRVKGQDGFCPLGPGLVRGVDVRRSVLRTYVNGVLVQEGRIDEFLFDPGYVLADLSRHMTLLPGDVVLLGTPAHSRPVQPGDIVEVEVTDVGRLLTRVETRPAPVFEYGQQKTESDNVKQIALMGDYWASSEAKNNDLTAGSKP